MKFEVQASKSHNCLIGVLVLDACWMGKQVMKIFEQEIQGKTSSSSQMIENYPRV